MIANLRALVDTVHTDLDGRFIERITAIIVDEDQGEVARITKHGTAEHAHLFAAAPELLAACFALVPDGDEQLEALADESDVTLVCKAHELKALRAAIAKATGGAK
jgi:hypothetical protein